MDFFSWNLCRLLARKKYHWTVVMVTTGGFWVSDIWSWWATNCNPIHHMCLAVGTRNIILPLTMDVTNQKERKPGPFIMPHTVHQKKRRGQFTTKLASNGIHHSSGVCHGIEPNGLGCLLLCKVSSSHVNHDFPMWLQETVEQLATCRSRNDVGAVIN